MNHSQADIVRRVLISLGLGTDPTVSLAWPVYAGVEPPTPDNCLTVYNTAGRSDGRSMVDGEAFRHLGVQVRVRAITHTTGFAKADAVQDGLERSAYGEVETLDGSRYLVHCFSAVGAVLDLGKEFPVGKRSLFTVNALVSIKML